MVFIKEDIIQFNWENGGCWYDGYKIDTINPDGTYNLLYGTTIEENIPESLLRGFEAKCIAEIKTLETDKIKLDNKIELLRAKLELFHSESVDKEAPLTIDAVEAVLKFTLILSDELPYDYAEGTARTEVLNMAERLLWARQKSALTNGQAASKEHLEKAQSLYEQAVDLYHSSYEGNFTSIALLPLSIVYWLTFLSPNFFQPRRIMTLYLRVQSPVSKTQNTRTYSATFLLHVPATAGSLV